jgi:acyl-CoA thioester hydrolase
MQIFEQTIKVTTNEIDSLNHVNNVVYVQWVQNIAELHWNKESSDDQKTNYYWVMVQHLINYKGAALVNDKIHLKTFIKESKGVKSTRIVEIYNAESKKLLAISETQWCLISRATNKPTRITLELESLFQ